MQISTGLEAQSLRESICDHIRILIEIESMTHSRKNCLSLNSGYWAGQDHSFYRRPKTLEAQRVFKVRVRTIFISLEEGYLNLTESKVTCDAIKDS